MKLMTVQKQVLQLPLTSSSLKVKSNDSTSDHMW